MNRPAMRDRFHRLARRAAAAWSHASGANGRVLARQRGRAAILMYHRILADDASCQGIYPGMFVRQSSFSRQVAWLTRRWKVVTLGELRTAPPAREDPPVVVLTFDDGWRDNLTLAWPVLEEYGVRATIFLVRDWTLEGTNRRGEFLRVDDVHALARDGIEFGAHTVSHAKLDLVDVAQAEQEMLLSREAVESWTGRPCEFFAYPLGRINRAAVDLAQRIFPASVTVGGGWWGPASFPALLPRIGVHEDVSATDALFERILTRSVAEPPPRLV